MSSVRPDGVPATEDIDPSDVDPSDVDSSDVDSSDVDPPDVDQDQLQPLHWRTSLLLASTFVSVLLVSLGMLAPVPFVVLRPGPAINTLGSQDGHPLIAVTGRQTYPAQGTLSLTTVTVSGGPGTRLTLFTALRAWADPSLLVVREEVMYPKGETVESSREENQQEMTTSQESATVAALRELDIPVPATLTVASVDAGTPTSPLKTKDVILAVNGTTIDDLSVLRGLLSKVSPGDEVTVRVRRDGAEQELRVPTRAWEDGRTVLGIRVDPAFTFPFDVKFQIDNVGGPSAGAMFALGIVDTLTPGDLTGGQKIAGTGTIDDDGTIGSIGGIHQKMVGARDGGATWFLAPADNCREVTGHVPDGLRVVKVTTLADARTSVGQIASGQNLDSLPQCR